MSKKRSGSFGARPCRAMKARYLADGITALPKSWRRNWMIARIVATPPWADFDKIRTLYAEAAYRTAKTGEQYVVDHVIPLQNPRVCGLHVPGNMRVLHYLENGAKSNYWCPEQAEFVF